MFQSLSGGSGVGSSRRRAAVNNLSKVTGQKLGIAFRFAEGVNCGFGFVAG